MAQPSSRPSALPGLLFLGLVAAPFVYSGYAQLSRPQKEPVRTLIAQQALWSGGQYSPEVTYFSSVFLLLLGPLALIFAITCTVQQLKRWLALSRLPALVLPSKQAALRWQGTSRATFLTIGAVLVFVSSNFLRIALQQPEDLAWLGSFGGFAQFFAIFFGPLGLLCLLDGALPASWWIGAVTDLHAKTQTPASSKSGSPPKAESPESYSFRINGQQIHVPATVGQQLSDGDHVAVRLSALFDRTLELRR